MIRLLPLATIALLVLPGPTRTDEGDASPPTNRPRAAPKETEHLAPPPRRTRWGPQQTDYVVETSDGWKLVVHRYRPAGPIDRSRMPVILCHGLGYDSSFFDLTPDVGLARYLATEGFDVWVVDLRGAGRSSRWVPHVPEPSAWERLQDGLEAREIPRQGFPSEDTRFADWTFDDLVDHDVPAILNLVKHHTALPRVAWLGHSLGANIMIAYLVKHGPDSTIGRFVSVSGQAHMPSGSELEDLLEEAIAERVRQVSGDPGPQAPLALGAAGIFYRRHNVARATTDVLEAYGRALPARGLLEQYLECFRRGELWDVSENKSYAAGLPLVRCACLIVGGAADPIADPEMQRQLFEGLGTEDRALLILGKQSGLSTDYGHCDPLIGVEAREEVYPILSRWIAGMPIGRSK